MNAITEALATHQREGTYRSLQPRQAAVDFSSNDYLGLSECPRIRAKLIAELEGGCPLGATGSRLLSGQTPYHERVENFLAQTFGKPSALLFSSGYLANLGVLSVFDRFEAHFFSDELNHASLVDGMRLSRLAKTIFRHHDLGHLEELLKQSTAKLKVIVTESVFSMDGDLAPLREFRELADRFGAWLIVDEAHATGVFGDRGLGRLNESGLSGCKIISVHTGGKALGGQGAFVLSSAEFRELLVNQARSFIFSTALSPLDALQIEFAVQEVLHDPARGAALLSKAEKWRQSLPPQLKTLRSASQIVPIVTGSNESTLKISNHIRKMGFDVRAIRSPTVAKGTERLRITIKSHHQSGDLERLREALVEAAT